jgi:protein-serine/threonine kinase
MGDGRSSSQFLSPSSLSISSSSSSFTDLSPLPSPHLKPKTSAFFSTPVILPPPSPEQERKSKTNSFFSPPWSPSSAYSELPGPSTRPIARRTSSGSTSMSVPELHFEEPSRVPSLSESFFTPRTLPTPPPSTYSASSSSREPSPSRPSPSKPRLPPLSRLLPSLFQPPSSPERGFVDVDQTPRPQAESWAADSMFSASPTSAVFPSSTLERPGRRVVSTPNPPIRARLPQPLPRETIHVDDKPHIHAGDVVSSASGRRAFRLVRELGQGAFSCVWLSSVVSTFHERTYSGSQDDHGQLEGTRPFHHESHITPDDGEGDSDLPALEGQLVAVKLTDRKLFEINDRTRVSFIREVEVLKVGLGYETRLTSSDILCSTSHIGTSLPTSRRSRLRRITASFSRT